MAERSLDQMVDEVIRSLLSRPIESFSPGARRKLRELERLGCLRRLRGRPEPDACRKLNPKLN